jgi:hypothetical protein
LGSVLQLLVRGRFAQEARNEQRSLAADTALELPLLLIKQAWAVVGGFFRSRHADLVIGSGQKICRSGYWPDKNSAVGKHVRPVA